MAGARPITPEESDSILNTLVRQRDRLFVLAGQHLGMRISELLSLKVGTVAIGMLPKDEITIARRKLKGGKSGRKGLHGRTIPVHPDLASALAIYLADFPGGPPAPDSYLFPSRKGFNRPIGIHRAWHIMKVAAMEGGLNADRISTHSLRKSFAAAIYEASGHDLRATQELLGHTEVETTVKYIEPNKERLAGLVRNMASRSKAAPPPVPGSANRRLAVVELSDAAGSLAL